MSAFADKAIERNATERALAKVPHGHQMRLLALQTDFAKRGKELKDQPRSMGASISHTRTT